MANNTGNAGGGRQLVAALVLSISTVSAGFMTWKSSEGFTSKPVIPTRGDVPTIGHGSTHYENGMKVKMTDTAISRKRAEQLALNLMTSDAKAFAKTLNKNTKLNQVEFDVYMDFIGQYGIGTWTNSSMRRNVIAGDYTKACKSLLNYRFAAGYDCSTTVNGQPNQRCWGVWTRQLKRHNQCMEVQ